MKEFNLESDYKKILEMYLATLEKYKNDLNIPNWLVVQFKTALSKNVTIEDWNQLYSNLKKIASDTTTLQETSSELMQFITLFNNTLEQMIEEMKSQESKLENKISKTDSKSILYGTSKTGEQETLPYGVDSVSDSIIQRNPYGRAKVEDPKCNKDIVNLQFLKQYLNDALGQYKGPLKDIEVIPYNVDMFGNNVYSLEITFLNGDVVNAGTFTAPKGDAFLEYKREITDSVNLELNIEDFNRLPKIGDAFIAFYHDVNNRIYIGVFKITKVETIVVEAIRINQKDITGEQGEQGIQGPPGPIGLTGPEGPQGKYTDVVVGTVKTGDAGTSAMVTSERVDDHIVVNFTIPRGNPGPSGLASNISGMFTLEVDENGNLYCNYIDSGTGEVPTFEYDQETGNLYYII